MSFFSSKKEHPVSYKDFEHADDCPCCRSAHRRTFLKKIALSTAGIMLPSEWAKAASSRERMIKMHNPHTAENLRTVYWTPDYGYIQPALNQINFFFRDFREEEIVPIDIDLINILHYMQSNIGTNRIIQLHSGYRTPKTNRSLRSHSHNVAKNSLHMYAKAADISVDGFNAEGLRAIAKRLNAGGVGRYGNANFIHVDSGSNTRDWHY